MQRIFLPLILFVLIPLIGKSQLQVSQTLTPQQLVQQVLIGYGVTVSNITYTGDPIAIGKFSNGGTTNLGLLDGVVMTSGNANLAIGPNAASGAGLDNTGGSDPTLASLVTTSINDACVLEFDFVPIADTVRFKYVFGSEEYPEYVGSSYNDVFGFFISGPNPAGGNYTSYNMATIPNSGGTAVSINNLNISNYSIYYVNNFGGYTIQYDGMTVVMTAWAKVLPCNTYHFKAAISDAGDGVLDSGVFLEAGSFSTNAVQVSTNFTIPSAIKKGIEGCNNAQIQVKLPKILTYDYNVLMDTMFGTATNGIDFPYISDTVIVPAGQISQSIYLTPLADATVEGQESYSLVFKTSPCTIDTVTIPIIDYDPIVLVDKMSDTLVCQDSIWVFVHGTMGIPPYTVNWTPASLFANPSLDSSNVFPTQTTDFVVGLSDASGCPTVYDTIRVEVYPKVYSSFLPDKFEGCEPLEVTFNEFSGPGAVKWEWDLGDGDTSMVKNPIHTYSAGIYSVSLLATAQSTCAGFSSIPNIVKVWPKPNAEFYLVPSVTTIENPIINFMNTSSGGSGNSFFWDFGDPNSPDNTSIMENPSHSYSSDGFFPVWLIVTSDKGCVDSATFHANVIVDEIVVPNVITPNGDGKNDVFYIENIERIEQSTLRIYNRWGAVVFKAENYKNTWDGENLADGVYFWRIDYKTYFREATENGTLTIIRE